MDWFLREWDQQQVLRYLADGRMSLGGLRPRFDAGTRRGHDQGTGMPRRKDRPVTTHQFTVIMELQPEGGYLVSVSGLPGCHTKGRTLKEAQEMGADAIRAYCASLLKHGEPIPVE